MATDPTSYTNDSVLDPAIAPPPGRSPPRLPAQHILFTGATGLVGSYLAARLASQTTGRLYCVIRATDATEAMARLREALTSRNLLRPELMSKIEVLVGDLEKPFLGLPQPQFTALANQCDSVVHCGAFVNHYYPYRKLKAANVGSVIEVVRFAATGVNKVVHYFSSAGIFRHGDYEGTLTVKEDADIDECTRYLKNGYLQTKWVGEKLLLAARQRGIPTRTYRLGFISGDSESGWSPIDSRALLLRACLSLKAAPLVDTWFDLAPVDHVSRVLAHLIMAFPTPAEVLHVYNTGRMAWLQIVDQVSALGYTLERLPYEQWKARVVSLEDSPDPRDRTAAALFAADRLWLMGPDLFMNCDRLHQALAGSGIEFPAADAALISKYIRFFIDSGVLPAPVGSDGPS